MFVRIDDDQIDNLVCQILDETIELNENEDLIENLKIVRAYFSIPGKFEDGKYDFMYD